MTFEELLAVYLGHQRWFAGDEPAKVVVVIDEPLTHGVRWVVVDANGARYQVLLGAVGEAERPDFFEGHERQLVGIEGGQLLYDAMIDARLAIELLGHIAPNEHVEHVRPMGVEQSNTSIVFDERLVLKLVRRLHDGRNPDVEVTTALADAGFENVAAPVAVWHHEDVDLAIVQPFLAGAAEGWALALTSLRDFYASESEDPAECGGDFGAEAARLGQATARMHIALADAFGRGAPDAAAWKTVMRAQLDRIGRGEPWSRSAARVFDALPDGGAAIRVHGDYHLGQVVRADTGWFVLDFEGEPARPLHERRAAWSPLKDVAGMMRSFHYAAEVARREAPAGDAARLTSQPELWDNRNREAFLEGYLSVDGIHELLPGNGVRESVLAALTAWELDKAIYEIGYERLHRPDWASIPEAAVQRLVGG